TDECAEETHDCGENALCNNTVGGYVCVCEDGYSPLDDRNVNCTRLAPTSITLPETASITLPEFATINALDTASVSISMDVMGTPRPARDGREPGLTVGLTLALILTLLLLLAVLVTVLLSYIARRRHERQRYVGLVVYLLLAA
ncbi:Protein kinase C-binding protein NELL2, partial [Geodia barretti]